MDAHVPELGVYGELEPTGVHARSLRIGAGLASAAQAFALLSFVFAYLYLRTLNSNGNWRPKHGHVHPSAGLGIALLVSLLVLAGAYAFAVRRLGTGAEPAWRGGALVALVAALVAFGVIVAQFAAMRFGPTSGGYASVFIGWQAFFALNMLGVAVWLETLVAQSLRVRRADVGGPLMLIRPAGDALAIDVYVTAVLGVIGYILLYVA